MSKYDALKKQVLDIANSLLAEGYFGTKHGSAGNVSALADTLDAVVITPSGMNYATLAPDDLCVVTLAGNKIEGPHEPSIEMAMHLAVYANRPDVSAVIHTHQPCASVFALLNEPIPALFDEVAVAIGHTVDVVPYALSGSPELIENVVSRIGNRCHCYVLQNHGALCVGPTLEKTRLFAEMLEKTAQIYYQAIATGRPVTTLPEPMPLGLFQITTMKQDLEVARKDALRAGA